MKNGLTQKREERRLRGFENRALRGIFGLKGKEHRGINFIMRHFITWFYKSFIIRVVKLIGRAFSTYWKHEDGIKILMSEFNLLGDLDVDG
jgi:hypothetical protein